MNIKKDNRSALLSRAAKQLNDFLSPSPEKKHVFPKNFFWASLGISVLFSAISIFVFPGYRVEAEDQVFYIAPLLQKADPSLLSNDFLMETTQTTASFFDEFFGFFLFGNSENIPEVLFWGAFAARVLFFLGISILGFVFSKNPIFALGIPVIFLLGHAGTVCNALPSAEWMSSFGLELHARSAGLSVLVLALGFFFAEWKKMAFSLASFAFLLHPISAIPLFAFFGAWILFSRKWGDVLLFLMPLCALLILLGEMHGNSGMSLLSIVDAEWREILRDRTPWLFSTENFLSEKKWAVLFGPLILLFFIALCGISSRSIRQKISLFFVLVFLLCTSGVLLFDTFHIALVGQLQLYRSLFFLQIIVVITAMAFFFSIFQNAKERYTKSLAIIGFIITPLGGDFFLIPFSILIFLIILFQQYRNLFTRIFFGIFGAILLFWCFDHPNITAQFQNLGNFFFSGDIILSIGLFFQWAQGVFPMLILLALSVFLTRLQKIPFLGISAGSLVGALLVFGIFWSDFQNIIQRTWADRNSETAEWILENTQKDALFFASISAESFCGFLRNHHGRSCFVSHTEGGQTAFSRSGSLEWRDRRTLQKNPSEFLTELQNRGVDFLIFSKDEDFPGTPLFENKDKKIFGIEKSPSL